jgi:hypothetical protein
VPAAAVDNLAMGLLLRNVQIGKVISPTINAPRTWIPVLLLISLLLKKSWGLVEVHLILPRLFAFQETVKIISKLLIIVQRLERTATANVAL